MIIEYLDRRDLQAFALSNSTSNALAERRLWRTYQINSRVKGHKFSAHYVSEKLDALLRVPLRARYVLALTIGPCDWAWDKLMLEQLQRLWAMVPRLRNLALKMTTPTKSSHKRGDEFAPVLRSLADHGTHLRLDTFKYEGMMRPASHLFHFLLSQTHLKELIGVDIFPTRTTQLGLDFLPSINTLVCNLPSIACELLPRRPAKILQVRREISRIELQALGAAVKDYTEPLETLMLSVDTSDNADSKEYLEALVRHFSSVQRLVIRGVMRLQEEDLHSMHYFSSLEDLDCNFICMSQWDAEHVSRWAVQLSSLQRVAIYPRLLWERDNE